MKNLNKNLFTPLFVFAFVLGFVKPISAVASSTPPLGIATTYGILASTYTNTVAGTTVNGDIGFTTGPAVTPAGVYVNYGSGSPYASAGVDQGTALVSLNSQACTFTFGGGAIDLSTDTTHGPITVYAPGVYCSSGAMNVGGLLTLNGSGTYIFRSGGALTTTAGSIVRLNGAPGCDIFWTPVGATTLAANTTFIGTVIDDAGITIGANTTWTGRALSFGGTISTDADTINVMSCPVTPEVIIVNNNEVLVETPITPDVIPIAFVTTPKLPDTGFPPKSKTSSEGVVFLSGMLILILLGISLSSKKYRI